MIYDDFTELMDSVVLPQRAKNPTHIRLDGDESGGNREVAGRFRHQNKQWKIHADTHYEPLIVAYKAIQKDRSFDPFVEKPTKSGTCLVLKDALRRSDSRFKHMYIYQDAAKQIQPLRRQLDRHHLGLLEDWQGNNVALACPSCMRVYIVSGMVHRNGRDCPNCGKTKAFVSREGKSAWLECDGQSVTLWQAE